MNNSTALTNNITKINTKLSSLKQEGEEKRKQVEALNLTISEAIVEGREVGKDTKARNDLRDAVSDIAAACSSLASRLQLEEKALDEAHKQEALELLRKEWKHNLANVPVLKKRYSEAVSFLDAIEKEADTQDFRMLEIVRGLPATETPSNEIIKSAMVSRNEIKGAMSRAE